MYGATLVLIVSFVALALLWERRCSQSTPTEGGCRRRANFVFWPALRIRERDLDVPPAVVIAASFAGSDLPRENLVIFVFVVFWLRLVAVS